MIPVFTGNLLTGSKGEWHAELRAMLDQLDEAHQATSLDYLVLDRLSGSELKQLLHRKAAQCKQIFLSVSHGVAKSPSNAPQTLCSVLVKWDKVTLKCTYYGF